MQNYDFKSNRKIKMFYKNVTKNISNKNTKNWKTRKNILWFLLFFRYILGK